MKRFFRPALLPTLLITALSLPATAQQAATLQPVPNGVTMVSLAQNAPVHWVSVEQIACNRR